MRRTIFYTQPLFFECEASVSASTNSITSQTAGNNITIPGAFFNHHPSGYMHLLLQDN